jgi:hypothetical protein
MRRSSIWSKTPNRWKSSWPRRCSTRPATTPTARFAISSPRCPKPASAKLSTWACATAAVTTRLCAPSTPARLSASTFSWTLAASATCTAIAAATQIIQPFTALHGYETPTCGDFGPEVNILAEAGILDDYQAAVEQAHRASAEIAASQAPEAAQSALYLLPLATRIRSALQNGLRRSPIHHRTALGPAGHFSYRRVAWEMFLALSASIPRWPGTSASRTSPSPSTAPAVKRCSSRAGEESSELAHLLGDPHLAGSLN